MGNFWSKRKRPLDPDSINSPNPKRRNSTDIDLPVLPQEQQSDNRAPPTMDYEKAAEPLCSNGLDLANLAVSSGILGNSWAAISKLRSQVDRDHQSPSSSETVKIQEFEYPRYKVIAFVTPPVAASYLHEKSNLVKSSSSETSEFQFLCSKKNPSFAINKEAISLFNSLQDKLSHLKAQGVDLHESIPHIITGDCLGGSIASLFTLWLLHTLGTETTKRPLCITFGSPLIGDDGFQQAVSQNPTWSACFLHVLHKDDCFPKIFNPSTMEQSLYKPFGTFLVCSESGSACFEAPKSIIELLVPRSPESAQIVNYESVIKCLERQLICKSHSEFSVPDTDLFKAVITAQVAAVGLLQIQPQNMDVDPLLRDIVKSEKDVLEQKNKAFNPAKDLNDMKVCLANLEWYKKKCENNGQGCGYYDSFKSKMARRDYEAIKLIRKFTDYWEQVVENAEKRSQREGAPLWNRWLFGGTNYRRLNSRSKCSLQPCQGRDSESEDLISPTPADELNVAAITLQEVYMSYRTGQSLADGTIVVEELWWKWLDFAELQQTSISDTEKLKNVLRWAWAGSIAAKVGKGLSKDEKAQKLALKHWLEVIDPLHRYGHNLQFYFNVWLASESSQRFFYWLDIGDGKEVNLEKCSRNALKHQCIKYLGPEQRKAFEVIIEKGKLLYRQSGVPLNTVEGSKWIFVLSTSRNLYVGQKIKGQFQHSSFLAGGAATAAGRLVAHDGILKAIWRHSGHYHPTEENFMEFISYLGEHNVDWTKIKECAADEEILPKLTLEVQSESPRDHKDGSTASYAISSISNEALDRTEAEEDQPACKSGNPVGQKWSTGVGPPIGLMREYPSSLQFQPLEQVKLSLRSCGTNSSLTCNSPILSPQPILESTSRLG